jgi:NAD(P)-dependent dehydrogenase (short-subunit alcohol dehydrogenase family)
MVNNAGISVESTHVKAKGVHETDESDWDKTMAVNAKGVFLGCKYAIRQMLEQEPWEEDPEAGEDRREGDERDRGWIVNTASVQGLLGYWGTRMLLSLLHIVTHKSLTTKPIQRPTPLPRQPL